MIKCPGCDCEYSNRTRLEKCTNCGSQLGSARSKSGLAIQIDDEGRKFVVKPVTKEIVPVMGFWEAKSGERIAENRRCMYIDSTGRTCGYEASHISEHREVYYKSKFHTIGYGYCSRHHFLSDDPRAVEACENIVSQSFETRAPVRDWRDEMIEEMMPKSRNYVEKMKKKYPDEWKRKILLKIGERMKMKTAKSNKTKPQPKVATFNPVITDKEIAGGPVIQTWKCVCGITLGMEAKTCFNCGHEAP